MPGRALAEIFLLAALVAVPAVSSDPLTSEQAAEKSKIKNIRAPVPAQCYTKTGANSNPCYVCHVTKNGRNKTNDWDLQAHYRFSAAGMVNKWSNLFVDRSNSATSITDFAILDYVRRDNYAKLQEAMAKIPDFLGWRPDLGSLEKFDADGFAADRSGWRAFRYKPFPGTFWPTNGSADTAMIRLPQAFRNDQNGQQSRTVYQANLAIVEANLGVADVNSTSVFTRVVEPIDEVETKIDFDRNGRLTHSTKKIRQLPSHYVGQASNIAVTPGLYPLGTEFLHPVYYLDPDARNQRAARLKELRYAVKSRSLDDAILDRRYREAALEAERGGRDSYGGDAERGTSNDFGWTYQAWIEDAKGDLRLQTREEHLYCMGCHGGIGVTADQSFSFPRKIPGAGGWGLQDLAHQMDVPTVGTHEPEYARWLRRVGGGDELRENREMQSRFFVDGRLNDQVFQRQLKAGGIKNVISPSRERALALDKAYRALVTEQRFEFGRDARLEPAKHVHQMIDAHDTENRAADHVYRDYRLLLDWRSTTH